MTNIIQDQTSLYEFARAQRIEELADKIYLIVDGKTKKRLLRDPGVSQVWHSKNQKLAEAMAKDAGGGGDYSGPSLELQTIWLNMFLPPSSWTLSC